MSYIDKNEIVNFFNLLNKEEIEYVLIKNINDELPNQLEDGKDIDILVKPDNINHFRKIIKENMFEKRIHPLGRAKGWNFAYQLFECEFWQKVGIDKTLYIDISEKLCCKSLTPKTWIPLDNCINDDIWKNKQYDKDNNWWIMDDDTMVIYLIVRSIFDKREFKDGYIKGIEVRKELLINTSTKYKLSKVFFKYSDRLIELIMKGRYSDIIQDYFSFTDY